MRRLIAAIAVALALPGCAMLRPDFTDLATVQLPAGDLTAEPVPVTLSVFSDFGRLQYVCNKAAQASGNAAPRGAYTACAISHASGCALAHWTTTTYAHMGHELLHCLANRASAAKRAALPAHFQESQP
jgi:hypothetical protein